MNVEEALKILKHHQQWRLGEIDDMPYEPKVLTEALYVAIVVMGNALKEQPL